MKDECLICKAPLEYLETDTVMECAICHKKENSKTRCVNGHYVCSECHMRGLDSIVGLCMKETSKDPIAIVEKMMDMPFCHMHGPEHHVMVGAALLTAYKNAGGSIDLERALSEMMNRGRSVPGGACGFWGACGAGVSTGMFVSIITGSTPLAKEAFGLCHKMTAAALARIGEIGGPRCCKRDSFISILTAVDFVKEHFGIEMEKPVTVCRYSAKNNQCIRKRCPFSAADRPKKQRILLKNSASAIEFGEESYYTVFCSKKERKSYNMTKLELVNSVSAKAEITKAEAHKLVDAVLASINEGLASDGKVVIPGFGSFEVRNRTARVGRNPRTGEQIKIKAARVPAFKPGKAMKELVNKKKKK